MAHWHHPTRRNFIRLAAMAASAAPLSVRALAASTLERARQDGYIRVGFANEAPFGFATPEGKLTGEAPEVAKAVLAKMGIPEVDGVLTEFGSLIPGLKAGRFDIIAAGMFMNPALQGDRLLRTLLRHRPGHAGQAGNPKGIKDYYARSPPTRTSSSRSWRAPSRPVMPRIPAFPRPARGSARPVEPCGGRAAVRAPCAALTALSIADMAKKSEGVETTKPFGEVAGKSVKGHGGFGFRKEDKALYKAFNDELKKFIGSPGHIALVEPFGFGKDYLPNKTMEQLCKGE